MAERHITDEEIHQASGHAPRVPPGVPKALCLNCGQEYFAWYAYQAHDCRIDLTEKKTYGEWLLLFMRYGYGILRSPEDRKFPSFKKIITGQTALTYHLQSDLHFASTHPPFRHSFWYHGPEWQALDFDAAALVSELV